MGFFTSGEFFNRLETQTINRKLGTFKLAVVNKICDGKDLLCYLVYRNLHSRYSHNFEVMRILCLISGEFTDAQIIFRNHWQVNFLSSVLMYFFMTIDFATQICSINVCILLHMHTV